jgi:hypothetical protein
MGQPQLIILPTEYAMAEFRADVRHMTNHDYDVGEIIKDVFQVLSYFPDSLTEIEKACNRIVTSYDRAGAHDDGVVLASGFGKLASKIRQMLIEGMAWDSSGVLRTHYKAEFGENWILSLDPCSHNPKPPSIEGNVFRATVDVPTPPETWGIIQWPKLNEAANLPMVSIRVEQQDGTPYIIMNSRTGAILTPVDINGSLIGDPVDISSKDKGDNENNPEQ